MRKAVCKTALMARALEIQRLIVGGQIWVQFNRCEIAALKVGDVINELKDGTWEGVLPLRQLSYTSSVF